METNILKHIAECNPLTREQIAEQVDCLSSCLPEMIVERLKAANATPDEVQKWYNPYFHQEVGLAMREFERTDERQKAKEKLLLLLSIYYHYPDCMDENIAADTLTFYLSKTK